MSLLWILVLYSVITIAISLNEMAFLRREDKKPPIVLDDTLYHSSIAIALQDRRFGIFSTLYTLLINALWLAFGLAWLRRTFIHDNTLLENTLFLLAFLLIFVALNLPLSYFKGMVQDKKNGFTTMGIKLFILDTLKAIALTAIFGFIVLYGLLFCLRFLGEGWWIYAFIFSMGLVVVLNVIYPTIIAPIFNKLTPLSDEKLANSIDNLMRQSGFRMSGVFVMDASKRDKRLNAFFGGLFKTKRVVLFDTLLNAMGQRELLAVLAHELGHFKHKDILKGLFSAALSLLLIFYLLAHIPASIYERLGLEGVDGALFLVFIMFGNVLTLLISPVLNALSRANEYAADAYAASMVGARPMSDALLVLARENKAFIKHSRLDTIFNQSHPSIYDRLEALK